MKMLQILNKYVIRPNKLAKIHKQVYSEPWFSAIPRKLRTVIYKNVGNRNLKLLHFYF